MSLTVSPLAPASFPEMPKVRGVDLFTGATGTYKGGRDNVLLARFQPGTTVAGVLTRSKCASAPIEWCRRQLPQGSARGLVVNAGNANAFTGIKGAEATRAVADHAAALLGCSASEVFLGSTGVIGEPLDPEPLTRVLDQLDLGSPADMQAGARAIMTTDTFAKGSVEFGTCTSRSSPSGNPASARRLFAFSTSRAGTGNDVLYHGEVDGNGWLPGANAPSNTT